MVRQVIEIVYREVRGLHRAAYVLALFAFASQLLALLRDRLLAHNFGAGSELDIYYAAFRIPDLLFVLFASSLSVYVLIPFVTRARDKGGDQEAGSLISQVFTLFMAFYVAVAALGFVLAPHFLPWLFPGIEDQSALTLLTRILLLQPLFLGLSNLFGVVTQLGHRFIIYALSPLLYNVGIVIGIVVFYPLMGLSGLALGAVFGALMHFGIQYPLVQKGSMRVSWRFRGYDWKELRSILSLSVPRALTLSMQQIVLLVLLGLASLLIEGSVSVFQLAFNLQSVPLAIIGVSYSVAAFPVLAELFSKAEKEKFALHILTALRHIIFWSVPAIALIIVLRAQMVRVVLGSGAFDWTDTRLAAAVLALLSLSLLAQAVNLVVVRAFYAGGQTRTPFFVTLGGSILAVISAYGLLAVYTSHAGFYTFVSSFMRLEDVIGSEILMLALGYSLATIAQTIVLTLFMGRSFNIRLILLGRSFVVALSAAIAGGLAAYLTLNFVVGGVDQERFLGVLIQGFLAGIAGVTAIIATYSYFKSPELREIYASFQKRLLKTDVVAPQEEIF